MEKQPLSASEQKIQEYAARIQNGESKESIFEGLPESFKIGIDQKLNESSEDSASVERTKKERHEADQKEIEKLKERLGMKERTEYVEAPKNPPIKYVEVIIDDEYMQKNLMPNGGLRMQGGQANWNGEVELMRYVASDKLSPQYQEIARDKIEKKRAAEEKLYNHEVQHIRNRENGLTPHVAAENMREFLAFRVLDELSANATEDLYDKDEMTGENILEALRVAEKKILDSYYGPPFVNEAKWYTSQHGNKPEVFSRTINPEKYHKIMKHYFRINGRDVLTILQKENKITEFTEIVNSLIGKLDQILDDIRN